jgi:hypothetical protein
VKPTPSPQDEAIIELLKRLETLKAEYPPELLAARREAYIAQIEQHRAVSAHKEESPSQTQIIQLLEGLKPVVAEYPPELLAARREAYIAQIEQRRAVSAHKEESPSQTQIIQLLEGLKPVVAEYPPELLAARRAAFIAQIEQHNSSNAWEASPSQNQVIELLENLRPAVAEYPSELLAARRAAFIAQIERYNSVAIPAGVLPSQNGKIFKLLARLKSLEIEYPLKMWSARRSVFVTQVREGKTSVLDAVRFAIQNIFTGKRIRPMAPTMSFGQLSMIIATLLVAVFMGSLAYGGRQPLTGIFGPSLSQTDVFNPSPIAAITSTAEVAQVVCKPGYLPPLCLAQEFDQSHDLTFPGNGSARPAVAKDTIPGYGRIHSAAYVNDGLYGPGASWISNSAYSWIKIDLGKEKTINTVTFGRDRLGNLNDGDPGQFVIAVALSDDIYADGNSSHDFMEYTPVYNSKEAGFDGVVTGPETVEASFDPVKARFVKITFENAGTAVDEIEVFMIQPRELSSLATRRPRATLVPASSTPVPTNTLIPSKTPTRFFTRTPFPTITLIPTTLVPTNTEPPPPTETPLPPPTETPLPPPTETPIPPPTETPEPPPTDTPAPPLNTSEPPTASPEPVTSFTDTPEASVLGP